MCDTCVMGTWKSKNRHKYLLQYHIIFVCKYRKKLLMSKQISDDIKQFSYEICQKIKSLSDIWRQIKGKDVQWTSAMTRPKWNVDPYSLHDRNRTNNVYQ